MPKKETQFHGILAVGRTKTDAINNYRLLAMSKGAAVQVDSGRSIAFVTQASSADGMFNPMSGNMDLETDEDVLKQLEFASNSSGDVEVNHLVCTSGCGAHIIFDSAELVKFCPHCTSALSSDEGDEESEESEDVDFDDDEDDSDVEDDAGEDLDASESGDEDESEDGDEDSDESDEESEDGDEAGDEEESDEDSDEPAEDDADSKEEADEEEMPPLTDDDGEIVISSEGNDNSVIVAASSLDEATNLFRKHLPAASLSSDSSNIEAHYKVCASEECGAHIVATDEIAECPACHAEAVEPDAEKPAEEASDVEKEEEAKPVEEAKTEDTPAIIEPAAAESSDEGDEEESEEAEENTLELSDDDGNILEEDTEEVDAMNDVEDEESESSNDLDVSYSSAVAGKPIWTAFYKGMPIAIASKESVGKNADMFDTPSFGHAVLATAKVSGVKKALGELGFAAIKHKVSVSKAVRRMVETQVAEARASIATEQQQFKERFSAALAASAVGLNRGFFAEKKNPIKAALWNSMSSAGIRNPESLIDTVFKSHSDAYHKVLFELATDLATKPVEVQDSLSKAIHGMSYQEVSTSSGETIEGRLETMGTSVSADESAPNAQPAGAVDRQQISHAVKSLGRRGR